MLTPKFTITNTILANIKRIATLANELNHLTFSTVVLVEMERAAREVSAFASTSIEGNPLPLTEVKKILKTTPAHIRDTEKEVLNYNLALEHINSALCEGDIELNSKLITTIHKQIMKQLLPSSTLGKFREAPVFVNNPRTGQPIYLPPDHSEVNELIEDLVNYVYSNTDLIDPILLAGIVHKQFVIIHPFIDGNGRAARLTTKTILAKMGINTFNLFSFENYYNRNVSKYFEEVGAIGNYYDLRDKIDFTSWLEYFTDGIIDELLRISKELQTHTTSPENSIKPHHHTILDFIKTKGFITDSNYAKLTRRSKASRNLDFRKLIELGLIKSFGKGKSTYYK